MNIYFFFQNKKPITFFVTFTLFLFVSGVCLPFNKGKELNFKEIKSQTAKKNICAWTNFTIFPKKNNRDLYKSLNCVHPLLIAAF